MKTFSGLVILGVALAAVFCSSSARRNGQSMEQNGGNTTRSVSTATPASPIITGDGDEGAMVGLGINNNGSAIPDYVYLFTMEKGKVKLIWDFETGDRADGGLRNVYAENGQLVIELFGKDRVIGGQLYRGEEGLCCPGSFTRARYKWTGKRFEQTSTEVLNNPSGNANPVMPE